MSQVLHYYQSFRKVIIQHQGLLSRSPVKNYKIKSSTQCSPISTSMSCNKFVSFFVLRYFSDPPTYEEAMNNSTTDSNQAFKPKYPVYRRANWILNKFHFEWRKLDYWMHSFCWYFSSECKNLFTPIWSYRGNSNWRKNNDLHSPDAFDITLDIRTFTCY